MADSTEELAGTWSPPTLEVDGVTYTGTGYPRLKEGRAFVTAVEGEQSVQAQLDASVGILRACGFPDEVIDRVPLNQVVRVASGFFLAALGQEPAPRG